MHLHKTKVTSFLHGNHFSQTNSIFSIHYFLTHFSLISIYCLLITLMFLWVHCFVLNKKVLNYKIVTFTRKKFWKLPITISQRYTQLSEDHLQKILICESLFLSYSVSSLHSYSIYLILNIILQILFYNLVSKFFNRSHFFYLYLQKYFKILMAVQFPIHHFVITYLTLFFRKYLGCSP